MYINRLRRKMALQADPTVIYCVTNGKGSLGRTLVKSDMRFEGTYNTYLNKGLPPTPIANPSLSSLKAVLIHPEETDALYFVADGKGGHRFSKTSIPIAKIFGSCNGFCGSVREDVALQILPNNVSRDDNRFDYFLFDISRLPQQFPHKPAHVGIGFFVGDVVQMKPLDAIEFVDIIVGRLG